MKLLLRHRRLASEMVHLLLAAVALPASFLLRFEFSLDAQYRAMLWLALPVVLAVKLIVFRGFGLRDLAWRYWGFSDLVRLGTANCVASAAAAVALRMAIGGAFPRSIHVLDFMVCLALMTAARAAARMIDEGARPRQDSARVVLIYGAGQAGVRVLSEVAANPRIGYRAAGFIDDDPGKRSLRIHGARVLGSGAELAGIARRTGALEVWIAAGASGAELTSIFEKCRAAGVAAKRVPALAERIERGGLVEQIREVRLEDLLGREPVVLDETAIAGRICGRRILITGAGGSIGSELCRQIARFRPAAMIGFDHSETALYQIDQEMREQFPEVRFTAEVGNIRNRRRLREVFRAHRPQSVYHAAAYKHVPMMEAHLFEAVANNVFGTRNVARTAAHWSVEDFVLVSSDKAVRPVSVMGATKHVAERVCQEMESGARSVTRFSAVRFGNVLGSNGSVIPRFQRQIAAGGPVTVTHPEMRRYFMTIPEAAQLVLQAAAMRFEEAGGGEVFVLEMGQPVRIADLARNLVLLSGLQPDADIRIEFTGIRPGEKLFEELNAIDEDTVPTPHPQIRVFAGNSAGADLVGLTRAMRARDAAGVVLALKEIVPDYNPSSFVLNKVLRRGERARSVVA